ncbi:MAG TPA: isoprenylcysteine carboxylmethyltransferase family protein [Candidatus Acidoferrum sp.]|nr:isoprenylcysteine carboxylmethyltransferase family protein [Candidatus Acidoferrum sp.]
MAEAGSHERGAKVRFPPPLVYLASILLGVAIRYALPLPNPADGFIMRAAGIAVILAGFWLIIEAWKLFKRTGQDPKPWTPSPELLFGGPYRFTRNPMYVGLTCIQVGLGLALSNLWIALLAAFSLLTVHFIAVLPEEKYLAEKFGHSYTGYVIKVRRYL